MALSRHGRNRSRIRRMRRGMPNTLLSDPPGDGRRGDGVPNFTPTLTDQARSDLFGGQQTTDQSPGMKRPDYPQLDTPTMQRERPQLDQGRQRNLRRLTYGSALAAGLGALLGSPEMTQFAASLAGGFEEAGTTRQLQHQEELDAYYDELAQVRQAQRQARNARKLAEYEQDVEAYNAAVQAEQDARAREQELEDEKELIEFREDVQTDEAIERTRRERELASENPTYAERTARERVNVSRERLQQDQAEEEDELAGYTLSDVNDEIQELEQILQQGHYEQIGEYGRKKFKQPLSPDDKSEIRDRIRNLRAARDELMERGDTNSRRGGTSSAAGGRAPRDPKFGVPTRSQGRQQSQQGQAARSDTTQTRSQGANQRQTQGQQQGQAGIQLNPEAVEQYRRFMEQRGPGVVAESILQQAEDGKISPAVANALFDELGL